MKLTHTALTHGTVARIERKRNPGISANTATPTRVSLVLNPGYESWA